VENKMVEIGGNVEKIKEDVIVIKQNLNSVGEIKENVIGIKENLHSIETIAPKIDEIKLRVQKISELDLTTESIEKLVNKQLTEGTKYILTSVNGLKDSFGQELEAFAEDFMKEIMKKMGSPKSAKEDYKEQIIASFIEMFHAKARSKGENLWQVRNKAELKEYVRVPRREEHIFNRAFFELEEEGSIFIPKGEKKNRYLVSKEGFEKYSRIINELFGTKDSESGAISEDFYKFYIQNLYDSEGNLLYEKISKFKRSYSVDEIDELKSETEELNEGDLDVEEIESQEKQLEDVKNILVKKKKKKN
jgi:hypothetical protein